MPLAFMTQRARNLPSLLHPGDPHGTEQHKTTHPIGTLTDLDDHIQAQETLGNSTGNSIVASGMAQLFCSLIPEEPFEKSTLQSRVQDIAGFDRKWPPPSYRIA
uniref:Uncharacterized protein n=1 Tax=Vespula pensylvanica TaxID=30213 RepID=A0A834PD15_VESPE|nr:hypothetical protein H0235_003884 [Vespula pensylvanica]